MALPVPFYEADGVTIYHGDALEILPLIDAHVLVSDVPYGIGLRSGMGGRHGECAIAGDGSTAIRDAVLQVWGERPAIVFGSWKQPRPIATRHLLVWDKGEHVGAGDLAVPWKPNHEEIYVLGSGFTGRRTGSVLRHLAVAGCVGTRTWRWHPTEKPESLMASLIGKCPPSWVVVDPFAGSGTTLVTAKNLGRQAIGIEIEERYCEIVAKRLSQRVLDFGDVEPAPVVSAQLGLGIGR